MGSYFWHTIYILGNIVSSTFKKQETISGICTFLWENVWIIQLPFSTHTEWNSHCLINLNNDHVDTQSSLRRE